jgi:hypothetical protein
MIKEKMSRNFKYMATRGMQLSLLIISLTTLYLGDTKAFVNSWMALLITFIPSLMRRKYDVTLDIGLSLWITSAVLLHAIGSVNLTGQNLYTMIPWWDHFTHALSGSVVAAAGYIALRLIDEYSDEIYVPEKLAFVFILIFVLAFGVFWEIIEFGLTLISKLVGRETILTQYGLEDTMKDLLFYTGGAVIVALFGEAYLNNSIEAVGEKLN